MLPSVDPFPASVSEADPGRNRGRTAGYRGGIYAYLADQRGHICLFSRLPGGRPAATSGANHARQRWFSPVDAELGQTLIRVTLLRLPLMRTPVSPGASR